MLDGDLSKGQDLWSFTEVCADWLMGFRKKTKQFQGRGSDTQRWNIIWLDYWVATINKTQPRVPRATREQEDLSQSLGILSEPSSKRMLVFPAQHTEGVAQHTEGQHCGGSDHPVPVCTYTTTEPWGTNPQQSAHQEHDHHPPVNQRDEGSGRDRNVTQFLDSKKPCCRKAHKLKWWFKPAQYTWRESRQYINKTTLDISRAQVDFVLHIGGEKSSALPLLQQNPCDFHAIVTHSIVCSSTYLNCH